MTIIDLISSAPVWIKILLSVLGIYLLTWFPRVIGGISKCIVELKKANKKLERIDSKLSYSSAQQARRNTDDWINAVRLMNIIKDSEDKTYAPESLHVSGEDSYSS